MRQQFLFSEFDSTSTMPDMFSLLENGAALVISVSGGKDSDSMAHYLMNERRKRGWTGDVRLVHADLGRAEWDITPEYVNGLAKRLDLPLHIVKWDGGDLIDRIWARWYKDPSRPCWPSSAARYCTSDLKRGPISKWIRNMYPSGDVICAMGLRADESKSRAQKQPVSEREDCYTKSRRVYNWLPIHDWSKSEVWSCIKTVGDGKYHPAYDLGNERLSCACCVIASLNDIFNGASNNPETYAELCLIEAVTGYSFRADFWLSDVRPDLLSQETLLAIQYHKTKKEK